MSKPVESVTYYTFFAGLCEPPNQYMGEIYGRAAVSYQNRRPGFAGLRLSPTTTLARVFASLTPTILARIISLKLGCYSRLQEDKLPRLRILLATYFPNRLHSKS